MSAATGRSAEAAVQPRVCNGFVPFPPDRAAAYRAAGFWTRRTVDSILDHAAASWPHRVAVVDGHRSHTYAELDQLADRAAAGFAALGIAPTDRVLLQLPNSVRFAVTLFGLLRAGAIPVLCLPGHRLAEVGHFADVSEATGLVIAETAEGFDYKPMAEQLVARQPRLRHVVVDGDPGQFVSLAALLDEPSGRPARTATDTALPAVLLVSGGTTGLPKLIPRTHDDYVYTATASAELCGMASDDVYLVTLPAAHNFPLACPGLLGAMSVGATTVFGTDPSPEAAFAVIARHGVTVTALVPALARLWAQACDWEPVTPASLRLLQVGGSKLSVADARRIRQTLTPGLQQVFGMAEGLVSFTRPDDPVDRVETTQGRPLSPADELRVVDQTGCDVPAGADGELLVRGPYTLNGYFRDPAANERSFTPDGFYRTGDQVRRLADGYLQVTGRVKDVIHRAGETVAAADLEDHLIAHPQIQAAAVLGLPDQQLGEKVCAAVVYRGAPVPMAELNRYLDDRGVAAHTRCDTLLALPALPTTAIGKVDKKAIAAHALALRRK